MSRREETNLYSRAAPPCMHCVAVGSKNPVKVSAAESVIGRLWPFAEVISFSAPSNVRAQPRSDGETAAGALYRAKYSIGAVPGADLGLGLEGGTHDTKNGMFLVNWAVAVDLSGNVGYGASARLQLPPCVAAEIRKGRELGDVMDELTGTLNTKHKTGAIGVFTDDIVTRQMSFEHAVSYAMARFLHPEWY